MPFTLSHAAAVLPLPRLLGRCDAAALLWFSLPGGLLAYWVFHRWLKGPLLALSPAGWLDRLHDQARACMALPQAGWGTATFPALQQLLTPIPGLSLPAYALAQHTSSALGMGVLAVWCWRWRQRTAPQPTRLPVMLTPGWKFTAVALLLLVPLAIGLGAGVLAAHSPLNPEGWSSSRRFIAATVSFALPAFSLGTMAYTLAWHAKRRHGQVPS